MRAYKCDRCGAFYTENKNAYFKPDFPGLFSPRPATEVHVMGSDEDEIEVHQLCDSCMMKLALFLNNEKLYFEINSVSGGTEATDDES